MSMNGTVALVAGRAALVLLALGVFTVTLFMPSAARSAAGQPDARFGIHGSLVTDLQGGSSERCFELLIQRDGKLVCVGHSARRDAQRDVALVRYLPSGRLDPTFGGGGIALFDSGLGGDDVAASAAIAADGKLVVAGVADVSGEDRQDFFVARFNVDGSIDSSFGTGGFVKTDGSPKSPDLDWGYAVALQRDGKIIVAGQTTAAGPGEALAPALLRYTRNGELDRTFGTEGKVALRRAHGDLARALLVQPDGKIVLGSSINRPPARFVLVRFDRSGRPDRRFGAGGIASTKIGFGNGQLEALARQRDGGIVAACSPDFTRTVASTGASEPPARRRPSSSTSSLKRASSRSLSSATGGSWSRAATKEESSLRGISRPERRTWNSAGSGSWSCRPAGSNTATPRRCGSSETDGSSSREPRVRG